MRSERSATPVASFAETETVPVVPMISVTAFPVREAATEAKLTVLVANRTPDAVVTEMLATPEFPSG